MRTSKNNKECRKSGTVRRPNNSCFPEFLIPSRWRSGGIWASVRVHQQSLEIVPTAIQPGFAFIVAHAGELGGALLIGPFHRSLATFDHIHINAEHAGN